jgi:hypothetical protein
MASTLSMIASMQEDGLRKNSRPLMESLDSERIGLEWSAHQRLAS